MRCEDIAVELDAYSTGELDAETCAEIERHIRQCPFCQDEFSRLRNENVLYRNYADAMAGSYSEKEKDHSSEVVLVRRAPSERRRRAFSISGWGWAAAAMVIMATGMFWYSQIHQSAPDTGRSIIVEQSAGVPMEQALKDLEQAIVLLQASYSENKPRLDPDLVKELDRNLEITRAAIRECSEALEKDPDNFQAIEFLAFSYQKQIDILKHFSEGL